MNISKITIDNIKGMGHFELNQSILPNRPNILVAPNGFGKSSLATAFHSLSGGIINLKPEEYYMGKVTNAPKVELQMTNGTVLTADTNSNTIIQNFSVHVANNQLIPNAKAQHYGKITIGKATLDIKPTEIIGRIPKNVPFDYKLSSLRKIFGTNSKVLLDISSIYSNIVNIYRIEKGIDMHVFDLKSYDNAIKKVTEYINALPIKTSAIEIKNSVRATNMFNIGIPEYITLCDNIKCVMNLTDDIDAFLSGWQYVKVRQDMKGAYKNAINYGEYLRRKDEVDSTLEHLNPVKNRFRIQSIEHKGKLIVNWPEANKISNGERDIMVFIAKLLECEYQSKKNCILVIDEFFDYLDDANLIAFQYYVSTLIDKFRKSKRLIFPILLTHLDPNYLKHFCFNDKRLNVCYLKETKARISQEMIKLVKNRENPLVKNNLDTYYFHYNPIIAAINITADFVSIGLNKDWGEPIVFKKKIDRQIRSYCLQPNDKFDPLAVCFSVRIRIEELVYNMLQVNDQNGFLTTHGTTEKLKFAQSKGVCIPETYFLLGIIYNHPLHDIDEDMSKPIGMKLDNPVIRQMIYQLWDKH